MTAPQVQINATAVIAGVAAIAAAYIIYKGAGVAGRAVSVVADTAKEAVAAVNPTNPDNVFATTVNKVGAYISGSGDWTLGGAAFDFLNPESSRTPAPVAPKAATKAAPAAPNTVQKEQPQYDAMGNYLGYYAD